MSAPNVWCRECGANAGEPCRTKTGKPTRPHAHRAPKAAPTPREQPTSRVAYQPSYKPAPERKGGASEIAVADARRYLDDLTFGRVPTDDAADVIRALLADPEDVYTIDEHDEIVDELEREHADTKAKLEEATRERALFEGRAEIAEGKIEQAEVDAEVDAKAAREERDAAFADAKRRTEKYLDAEQRLATLMRIACAYVDNCGPEQHGELRDLVTNMRVPRLA